MMTSPTLPTTRDLSQPYTLSFVVAGLMGIVSLAGIFFQSAIYPTQELRQSFVPNDVVNLFIGLPILLGSMGFARRGSGLGLLFLPGALFFAFYNYVAYTVAMPITIFSLAYVTLVALSAYGMIQVIACIDARAIQQRLRGRVPEKVGGGILLGFGILFLIRAIGVLFNSPTPTDLAVAVADLATTPAWIIGGAMLWRRHPLGYVGGLGLLFQASMLFVALIIFFLLQPLLTPAPFALADTVVVLTMGLFCFVPFALFVRGVAATETLGEH